MAWLFWIDWVSWIGLFAGKDRLTIVGFVINYQLIFWLFIISGKHLSTPPSNLIVLLSHRSLRTATKIFQQIAILPYNNIAPILKWTNNTIHIFDTLYSIILISATLLLLHCTQYKWSRFLSLLLFWLYCPTLIYVVVHLRVWINLCIWVVHLFMGFVIFYFCGFAILPFCGLLLWYYHTDVIESLMHLLELPISLFLHLLPIFTLITSMSCISIIISILTIHTSICIRIIELVLTDIIIVSII